MHVGLHDFMQFVCYYIITKATVQVVNTWARRNQHTTIAAVTGLMA